MEKLKSVLAIAIIFIMTVTMIAGCSSNAGTSPSPSDSEQSATVDPTTAETESSVNTDSAPADPETADADVSNHEIYTMENRIALSTVVPPILEDRSDIEKALPETSKSDLVIGYICSTAATPWFQGMIDIMQEEADKYGYEYSVIVTDQDLEKQAAAYETFISQGVDCIITNPINVNAEAQYVQEAVDAGIPVISNGSAFASDVPTVTAIAQNFYKSGWEVGKYYASVTDPNENIKAAILIGLMGNTVSESRINGLIGGFIYERHQQLGIPYETVEDAMLAGTKLMEQLETSGKFVDSDTNFEVVNTSVAVYSAANGLTATEDILTANPDINLLISDNDQMALGGITAMQNADVNVGTDIQVISVSGGISDQLAAIKDGLYFCSGLQSTTAYSVSLMSLVHMIFEEGFDANNLPAETELANYVVTIDNVDQFSVTDSAGWPVMEIATFKSITELNAESN